MKDSMSTSFIFNSIYIPTEDVRISSRGCFLTAHGCVLFDPQGLKSELITNI